MKQSRTAGDDFLAPAEPRRTNRTAKRNASDDNFQTPADPGPSQTSTPDKKTTHSPAKYRKNIDREDRHKPLDKSSGSDVSDDDDISICE